MRLTLEEAREARALVAASPDLVPALRLSELLSEGYVERVARASALYFNHRLPGALSFYVLALVQSGSPADVTLARTLLTEQSSEAPELDSITDLGNLVESAQLISRFDIPRYSELSCDLGRRLLLLARCLHVLDQSTERCEAVVRSARESGLGDSECEAVLAFHRMRRGQTGHAFGIVKDALSLSPEHPYLKMAAHALFTQQALQGGIDVLDYSDKEGGPRQLAVVPVQGAGLIFKEFTGEGFHRNEAGRFVDSNFGPIRLVDAKEPDFLPAPRQQPWLSVDFTLWINANLPVQKQKKGAPSSNRI